MKTRFRFTKTGSVKFIGHLDLMRFFQKAIRRASLDVAYSKGYSPHQLMSFASPLGVGLTSDGEYIDIEFNSLPEHLSKEQLLAHMNHFMTEEIIVTDYEILPDKAKPSMALLEKCDYMISFRDGYEVPTDFVTTFTNYINQDEILITKKTKKSEKEMDVAPHVFNVAFTLDEFGEKTNEKAPVLHAQEYENGVKVYLTLTSGSVLNIKPELIINDYLSKRGIEVNPYSYQVHRLNMYFKKEV